jgi:uncharacterized protein (TIGR02996 family)
MNRKKKPAKRDDAELDRGRALLRIVEQAPTDDAALLVYSDWLEETGDLQRLAFLRAQQQIRSMKVSHPKLLERGRALYELGKQLPREWVETVTYPKLADTAWTGRDDDGFLVLRFRASGMINYSQPSGTYENGHWEQIGVTVALETNAHYADYFGVIVGNNVMRGNAHNVVERTWRWKVTWTNEPAVVAVPENVNRTIHDHHVRAAAKRKRAKVTKKPAKRAKAKALPRKVPAKRKAKPRRRTKISTRSR